MAFQLGNFYIDEILYGVAEKTTDGVTNIEYVLDQLSSASIEISADSTDITDKKGNVIRTTYRSKTGTFTATNALLHPAAMNAQSGSSILYAGAGSGQSIVMPRIIVQAPGTEVTIGEYTSGSLRVMPLYGNGANGEPLTAEAAAALISGSGASTKVTLPSATTNGPTQYLVKYTRNVTSGAMLQNTTSVSSDLVQLTLFCAVGDPCSDALKPCYVVIPRFAADPSMTISLDSETQEIDFNGNLNVDYCAGTASLYYIYFPDESMVVSGTSVL